MILLGLLAGCYNPSVKDCRVPCASSAGCPSLFSCSNGFCAQNGVCSGVAKDAAADESGIAADVRPEANGDGHLDLQVEPDALATDLGSLDMSQDDGDDAPAPGTIRDLELWLDASELDERTGLSLWHDKSGNGHHASPLRPGGAVPERDQTIDMVTANLLGSLGGLQVEGDFSDFRIGVSVFFVVRPREVAVNSTAHLLDLGPRLSSGADTLVIQRRGSAMSDLIYDTYLGNLGLATKAPVAIDGGAWQLLELVAFGGPPGSVTPASLFRDGREVARGNVFVPHVVPRTSNFIGDSNRRNSDGTWVDDPFQGSIGEILMFRRALTVDERVAVEDYLSTKWRVALRRN